MPSVAQYCTVAQVRRQIGKQRADQDDVIDELIDAYSRTIDQVCNRPDGFLAPGTGSARVYAGSGGQVQRIDEAAVVSSVAVKSSVSASTYDAWAAADWTAATGDPKHPIFNRTPYTLILAAPGAGVFVSGSLGRTVGFRPLSDAGGIGRQLPTVQVTARWGYATTTPSAIVQACITMVARAFRRGEFGWADAVTDPDTGSVLYRKTLDPDVKLILEQGRYIRPSVAGIV